MGYQFDYEMGGNIYANKPCCIIMFANIGSFALHGKTICTFFVSEKLKWETNLQ